MSGPELEPAGGLASGLADEGVRHLLRRLRGIADLESAADLLAWDQWTYMPEAGADDRASQIATLRATAHERRTAAALGDAIEAVAASLGDEATRETGEVPAPGNAIDSRWILGAVVRVARRDRERALRVPTDFVEAAEGHFAKTYARWMAAREANDFSRVAGALAASVALAREMASFFPEFDEPADALIDPADPGMTTRELRDLFARLRVGLVPRVAEIADRPIADDSFLHGSFEPGRQLAFGESVLRRLGLPEDRTRQDLSPHPFMVRIGRGDVRVTTRVREDFLGEALFSSMHEAGHALYELGIDPRFTGTPLASGASSGVHESQSRLVENVVGRSEEFWKAFLPDLGRVFPSVADVPLERFVAGVNRVERSLVRTDADEVTYDLHVMARFDFELAMLDGSLAVEDLPGAWSERMRADLGVAPPDDRLGALQDVHWYAGFPCGAFQGYTIGNLLAAQLFETAEREMPDLRDDFRRGRFERLLDWLGTRVHRYGRALLPTDLVESATGRELGVDAFLAHLDRRFAPGREGAR